MRAKSRFAGLDTEDLDRILMRAQPAFAGLSGARIFVTGGTGFFGRWLLASLAQAAKAQDVRIVALTRDADAFSKAAPDLAHHHAIKLVEGDVRSFADIPGRFTHIIHAATDTSATAGADLPTLADTIVNGSARVLRFARACGARRLVYVSSGAVYGPQPPSLERLPETHEGAPPALDPASGYGQAKRLAEMLCVNAANGELAPVIARAFAFVGPGLPLHGHFAIGNFIANAAAGQPIIIRGSGETVRSYLYAGDLAAWLITLLVYGQARCAYNVGSDQGFSLKYVASRVAAQSPAAPPLRILNEPGEGQRRTYVPCIARARGLGLDVWTPLDEAIRRTITHTLANNAGAD